MRLTLRTLLAYLDEIPLPPEELQGLKEKIDESEFAQGLIQRIRSALRRLRLGAPKVDGKGMGLDANTVAEYLDNTLPAERVPDFERVCLESDVHLAEVAACHQILALVVSEPANVPADLRERMYLLPEKVSQRVAGKPKEPAAPVPVSGNGSNAPEETVAGLSQVEVQPAAVTERQPAKASLPEYLRRSHWPTWKPWFVTAALVLLMVAAAVMALGKLDENHVLIGPLLRWTRSSDERKAALVMSQERAARRTETAKKVAPLPTTPSTTEERTTDGASQVAGSPTEGDASERQPGEAVPPAAAPEVPVQPPPETSQTKMPEAARDALGATPPGGRTVAAAAAPSESDSAAKPSEPTPAPMPPEAAAPGQAEAGSTPAAAKTVAPSAQAEIGRLLPGERKHVLARWDAPRELWYRLPEREVLRPGELLFVLPSYRPQLAFTSGIQSLLIGPCYLELLPPSEETPSGFAITSGAALLDTAGVGGSSITVRLAGRTGLLKFVTPDATLAVEVTRRLPLGHDPALVGAVATARLVATSGQFEWYEEGQPVLAFSRDQEVHFAEGLAPAIADHASIPEWVQGVELREIDLRASRDLEPLLAVDRPLSLSLREQVSHRQVEVAALAIHSLALLGEFEPAIAALHNERFSPYWKTLIQALQLALVVHPRAADELQAAWQKQRPDDAAVLYRLLWGFSNEQLLAGDDQRLVQMLEHPALDVRVLAFDNLQRITGRTYLYRPEREPSIQRRPLQDWKTALSKGEIRWPR